MSDKNDSFWGKLNKLLKSWPNGRTSDELVVIKSDDSSGDSAPRSASAKITQQNRGDKYSTSSRAAHESGRSKSDSPGHSAHLGHLPATNKPMFPPAPPKKQGPLKPMGPLMPMHQLNFIKPKI